VTPLHLRAVVPDGEQRDCGSTPTDCCATTRRRRQTLVDRGWVVPDWSTRTATSGWMPRAG
jgi:hypothetical protein